MSSVCWHQTFSRLSFASRVFTTRRRIVIKKSRLVSHKLEHNNVKSKRCYTFPWDAFEKSQLSLNLWALGYRTILQTHDTTTSLPPHPQKIHSTHIYHIYHHYTSTLLPSTTKGLEVLTVTSAKMVQLLLVCEDVYKATEPSCVSWCQSFCLWWNGHVCLLIH